MAQTKTKSAAPLNSAPVPQQVIRPTAEQERILTVAANTKDNLIINALAGAAKTTTLKLIAKRLQKRGTCVAFNKKTAEELKKAFPGYVECATLNSIGHRAWMRTLKAKGLKVNLDTNKILKLVEKLARVHDIELEPGDKSTYRRAIDLCRNAGYTPRSGPYAKTEQLCGNKEEFLESLEAQIDATLGRREYAFIDEILTHSIKAAEQGDIDFSDQLYMPTLFGGIFEDVGEYLAVDEAQDLSPLNHQMIRLMLKGARLFAVGDRNQSIYRFRGAMSNSMELLQEEFKMTSLELTTTFRCARDIVRNVHWRTPTMKWAEWAPEGTVESLNEWGPSTLAAESFVICRNNAPLFKLARQLVTKGVRFKLVGNDMLAGLTKIIEGFGPQDMLISHAMINLEGWAREKREVCKPEARENLEDKIESLKNLMKFGKTIRDVMIRISYMNNSDGRILLMTGHKAKGLETDTVYHLDPDRIPSKYAIESGDPEAMVQEDNLRYVIDTRPKRELFYISSENFSASI